MGYRLQDNHLRQSVFSPICSFCIHFHEESLLEEGKPTCRAFRDMIPPEIWSGENRHTTSYPGDQGIQFRSVKGVTE